MLVGGCVDTGLRVLVVDDDPFTRVMLCGALRSNGCEVVADSASAPTALREAREHRPDAAVLDLDLGEGPTGIDLARGLRRLIPDIGIVMLSTYEEPRLLGHNQPPLPDGSIYLVKRTVSDPKVLLQGLRLSRQFSANESSPRKTKTPSSSSIRKLSDQQVEIMRLVAGGQSNAEIARRRFLTESAVEKAVARLIKQLDIQTGPGQNPRVLIAQAYYQLSGAVSVRRD